MEIDTAPSPGKSLLRHPQQTQGHEEPYHDLIDVYNIPKRQHSHSSHVAICAVLSCWHKACWRESLAHFKSPHWLRHMPQTRQLPAGYPSHNFLIWLGHTHNAGSFRFLLEHHVLFQPTASHPGRKHVVPGQGYGRTVEMLCKSYQLYCIKKDLLELETHSVVGFILISALFTS